jgi:hypothetical protein
MKDNILTFSRQNTKLCAAEADFERLLRSKEETKELFGYEFDCFFMIKSSKRYLAIQGTMS